MLTSRTGNAAAAAAQAKTVNTVKDEKQGARMLSSLERRKQKQLQLAKTTNKPPPTKAKGAAMNIFEEKRERSKANAASLGVIRLDYDYETAPGDIDSPASYAYDVSYRAVPGLTFAMCQSGEMEPEVEARVRDDCGEECCRCRSQ